MTNTDDENKRVAVAVHKCKDKRETYTCGHTFIHHTVNHTITCAHSYVHDDIPVVPVHDIYTHIHTHVYTYLRRYMYVVQVQRVQRTTVPTEIFTIY